MVDEHKQSTTAIKYMQRRCIFQSGDGSPSYSEYQHHNESLDDFVARMLDIQAKGGGYATIAGWQRVEVYDDDETAALALDSGSKEEHRK